MSDQKISRRHENKREREREWRMKGKERESTLVRAQLSTMALENEKRKKRKVARRTGTSKFLFFFSFPVCQQTFARERGESILPDLFTSCSGHFVRCCALSRLFVRLRRRKIHLAFRARDFYIDLKKPNRVAPKVPKMPFD